ncbi:MAG: hypothetical protein DHS20C02_09100 [Micavibrio sp.]|nr:MAG: hypothetical protein DHS20C02_09100 [Micavibrio sp.]
MSDLEPSNPNDYAVSSLERVIEELKQESPVIQLAYMVDEFIEKVKHELGLDFEHQHSISGIVEDINETLNAEDNLAPDPTPIGDIMKP